MTHFVGKHFISKAGAEELANLRVNASIKPTADPAPIEMLARVPSDECGCPEELWRVDGILLLFHLEEDGDSDAFLFSGDWEDETTIKARNLDDLRAKAFQWFAEKLNPEERDCRDLL